MVHHCVLPQFPWSSSEVLPSNSNAWVSFLFCGPGDSSTNGNSRLYLSQALTGWPGVTLMLFQSLRLPPHSMGRRKFRNVVGPTPAGALTCWLVVPHELPPLRRVDLWGTAPNSMGDTASVSLLSHGGLKTPYKVRRGFSSILRKVYVLLTLPPSNLDHTTAGIEASVTTNSGFRRPSHDIHN